MKRSVLSLGILLVVSLVFGGASFGRAADLFTGDSAIYGSAGTIDLRPNVLFVVDNSSFMKQGALGTPYDPAKDYTGAYTRDAIYRRISATGGTINYDDPANPFIPDISDVTCTEAHDTLSQTSYYTGSLQSNGSCRGSTGFYYTGNLLNYITNPPPGNTWQSSTFYNLGDYVQVKDPTTGDILYYECVAAGNSTGSEPVWGPSLIVDGGITWQKAGSVMDMVKEAIKQVAEAARNKAKFGVMVFGNNNLGGQVIAPVVKMASTDTVATDGIDGDANLAAFESDVDNLNYVAANTTEPLNTTLWDANLYYAGTYSSASSRMGTDGPDVASDTSSPIDCQKIQPNFVVILTMGNSYQAGANANTIGDQDAMYNVGDVDDAAKRLYSGDITVTPATPANPQITTTVIKLINDEPGSASDLTKSALRRAAAYGHGGYYLAQNSNKLAEALLSAIDNIVLESDTSFIAPVVPTSPENRTYSGERVYLGFFKPQSKKPWSGNLKKYGINSQSQIVDQTGAVATDANGSFNATAESYWNNLADAGQVEVGGVGERLLTILDSTLINNAGGDYTPPSPDPHALRKIYTYMGSKSDLTDLSNAFSTANSNIKYDTTLGLTASTDRDKLIKYMYGLDSWDDNGNLITDEKRNWILGDILHSKPLVVNYAHYDFNSDNEKSCTTNQTMIYVGANDGMLHAFRDCDGSEAWAFIPPSLLGDLKLLPQGLQDQFNPSGAHPYFVDGSPVAYIYDHDDDGDIGPIAETSLSDTDPAGPDDGSKDKVILIFGLRRGGDSYYALDVTNPKDPKYLWEIHGDHGGTTTATNGISDSGEPFDFSELGETWSTPQLAKMKINVGGVATNEEVAFVGGGYDREEDSRYGNNWAFSEPAVADEGVGNVTSTANTNPFLAANRPDARGRAVYAFKVATLDSYGVPTVPTSPSQVWSFTPSDVYPYPDQYTQIRYLMKYAVPSDVTVLDTDYNGYADRLYVGDLGGDMFSFNVGSADVGSWSARNIFWDNYAGQKIFYRPSVSLETGGTVLVAFGTGDRAHPLNTALKDSFYMVKDTGQTGVDGAGGWKFTDTASPFYNATADALQSDLTATATVTTTLNELNNLSDPTYYGWYINLDQPPSGGTLGTDFGEKVLAAPLIFNKVAYYTTYQPNLTVPTGGCTPGNLGVSRLYAVNYKTGEAVLDFANANTAYNNDNETPTNSEALSSTGKVLRRADRELRLGEGIPSGLVVVMPPSGDAKLFIGCGGGLCSENPVIGGSIIPIYWLQW